MPLEFNLTHEETVQGWDNVMAKYKESAIDFLTFLRGSETEEDDLELAVREAHNHLNAIIDMQNNNNITEKIHEHFAYIIGACIFALQPGPEYAWKSWMHQIALNRDLMIEKNKVYGSAWSIMRPIGIIDIIHVKIHRIISIIEGQDNKFEGSLDSFQDIINYCAFCVMRMELDTEAGVNYETN